jgi:hypothetical protein
MHQDTHAYRFVREYQSRRQATRRGSWLKALSIAALAALVFGAGPDSAFGQPAPPQPLAGDERITLLIETVGQAIQAGDRELYESLVAPTAIPEHAAAFAAAEIGPNVTNVVIKERFRQQLVTELPGSWYRVIVDAFIESGDQARVSTWQFDVQKLDDVAWQIWDHEYLSTVGNLHRLSVNATTQYDARDFTVRSEDLMLTMSEGSVFTIETARGVTGLILTGRGDMRFEPTPETEKGQIRVFAGHDVLETRFDAAYIRFSNIKQHGDLSTLTERAVNERDLRRAQELFEEESAKAYVLELGDLSSDSWSLLPRPGDFLAEIRTRQWDTLTYSRASQEPEDISVFERETKTNISIYASESKLASRGRFYDEDDYTAYDVLDYEIDLAVNPQNLTLSGVARMRLRVKTNSISQLTLRLAESLVVRSVNSEELGRLFSLRMRGHDSLYVNLPATVLKGTDLTLTITYAGSLAPQTPDRDTLQEPRDWLPEFLEVRGQDKYLYSNSSYWYPQSTVADYVTATLRLSVPARLEAVASGTLSSDSPRIVSDSGGRERKVYVFTASRPVRYLAFVVSRFDRADRVTIAFENSDDESTEGLDLPPPLAFSGAVNSTLDLTIEANPLHVRYGRELMSQAIDVASFYRSLIGDSPYESFTVALIEHRLPGGHSPAYFATLHRPLPGRQFVYRTDPADFRGYPEFFLAHEVAHQWWGQAVSGRNYHEQWVSEGFAQYFAALYALRLGGEELFSEVLEQLRKWSIDNSDQGPVYLGYRLGHVKNDSRIFRSLVYNKGALVLHMLRRLLGDDVFFRGIRRFYVGARFAKVGTDDLRFAMAAESGLSLDRFFDRWIYGSSLPDITFSHRVAQADSGQDVVLQFEQGDEVFDVPVTVRLEYSGGNSEDIVVPVTEKVVEFRVPLEGRLRRVSINEKDGTLAEIRD